MMEKLLDFVLQAQSPFRVRYRENSIMTKFSHPSYEYPLEVIGLLIELGY